MTDFFDQDSGNETMGEGMSERPDGANVLVNGSYQTLEEGSNFLQSVKQVALQAGFGKFKVWLNGNEIRKPSTVKDMIVNPEMNVEIRPYDEAGC